MKKTNYSTERSTVKASKTGQKISEGLVKFHMKAHKPKKISLREAAEEQIKKESK